MKGFAILIALLFLFSEAYAQSLEHQRWTTNVVEGEFPSRDAALAAVRAQGGVYALAEQVESVIQSGSSASFVYGAVPKPMDVGSWGNYRIQSCLDDPWSKPTEAEAIECARAGVGNAAGCPPVQYQGQDEWQRTNWAADGTTTGESNYFYFKYHSTISTCQEKVIRKQGWRSRTVECPVGLQWNATEGACVRHGIAQIDSKPQVCSVDDLQDNPCNVSTGEKYQSETDLALPWISFSRHYHSTYDVPKAGLGPRWTHSLNIWLLSASTSGAVQLPSGYILKFQSGEATDGSGRRLVYEDSKYKLRSQGEDWVFGSLGKLLEIRHADGSSTLLEHDGLGLLTAATHSSGRSLSFTYEAIDGASQPLLMLITSDGETLVTYDYDTSGRLVSATYVDGSSKAYSYDDARYPNALTSISDENGQAFASFTYGVDGYLTVTEHAGGAGRAEFEFLADGSTRRTDALGKTSLFAFDSNGGYRKVSGISDASGQRQTTFAPETSDFRRRPISTVDRNGNTTTFSYADVTDAELGTVRLTITTEGSGTLNPRESREWRDRSRGTIVQTEQGGRRMRYQRNPRGQVVTQTATDLVAGNTRTTTSTYCEQIDVDAGTCPRIGLLTSVDGPRTDVGDLTTYQYYAADHPDCATSPTTCAWRKGDLWKVTDALGRVTETLRYDGAGRVLSVRDANDVVTDFEYHPRGWMTARKVRGSDDTGEADDRITTIDYLPTGLVSSVTLPDGSFTSYVYDAAHRLTDIVDADGNRLHYTLDNAGNRIKEEVLGETGALKRTLSRVYNQLGQLATQADAGANPTDFSYDANGNLKTTTDALDRVTQNDYDPLNRLIGTLQDIGGIEAATAFEYDALDNLTKVTDPKGLDTVYTYNGFGDLTQLTSPDTGVTAYTYDAAGNRTGQTDARGETTSYGYDALNRLTSVSYSDSSLDVAYAYDTAQPGCATGETFAVGRLGRMSDGSGHTDYCYDRFGQLVRKVQVTDGQSFTLRYAYTKAGQLSQMTYPDGTEVDYVRDGQGRTSEIGVTAPGGSREVLLSNASWYPFGPVGAWTFGNGRTLSRTLDLDYRPQSILSIGTGSATSGGGLDLGFGFDPVGNLTSLHGADRAEPPRVRLDYDALSRLTAFRDGPTDTTIESYGYDATGNRTSFTDAGGAQTYTYPTDSHRLSAVAGVARGYDAVGNTTTIGTTREYVYNAANRLSAVKQGGAMTMNYGYNGRGERVHRHLGSDVTYSVYDEAGHWIGDYDASGAPKQQAIWLDDLPVGLLNGAATATNRLHYIEPDHLGTPRAVIEPQRDVAVWTWDIASEAFGNSAPSQDPDGDSTAFVLDMRFPGQRYDAASGLNYNYFRDYEAGTGRYSQSDPIGLSGGVSTYAYVRSSSLQHADPLGLVDHVSGRWIDCGKGCRIRIDFTFDGNTGQRTRHLHWECKGESGECGEFGKPSHGGTWDDAPRHIRECALRNGFSGQTSRDQEQRRTAPEMPEMSPGSKAAAAGAVVGAALVALFGYLVGG